MIQVPVPHDRRLIELEHRVDKVASLGPISANAIGSFRALLNSDGLTITVTFLLASAANINSLQLYRNTNKDLGTAKLLESWHYPFNEKQQYQFTDTSGDLKGKGGYYWVKASNAKSSNTQTFGPQGIADTTKVGPAGQITEFAASSNAGVGGAVTLNASFPVSSANFSSCKIYASGYLGNVAFVAVAQSPGSPFSFVLQQTGEVITLKAIAVNLAGVEAASGPTVNITLNGVETAPAKIMPGTAVSITGGTQVNWTAGAETDVTQFKIYRATLGGGFGAASNIGTVASTGATSYSFLDTGGSAGRYEYYVVATGPAGDSSPSDAISKFSIATSADLPPNVPQNTTNFVTVDSIDNGVNATIRVYGTGGVGTTWTAQFGYGNQTYPAASLVGYSYATKYYVCYDTVNGIYVVTTSFPTTLPDNYIWVATITTVSAGGGGGTPGGGGATGGGGGRPNPN